MPTMKFGNTPSNEPLSNVPGTPYEEVMNNDATSSVKMQDMKLGTAPSNEPFSNVTGGTYEGVVNKNATSSVQHVQVNDNGMSSEELNDANKIKVTVADYKTPLVVFFGPPACGKTMTLIRLTRYLREQGYSVEPVTSFRPTYDTNYSNMCKNFDAMVGSEDAAQSTSKISFMLVQVLRNGKPLCQILEGPGEYYFKPEDPGAKFPKYVNNIISSQNRKIWAIMVEPADKTNPRMGNEARRNYVKKIHDLKTRITSRDKILFVFNKIDETPFVSEVGKIKYNYALQQTEYLYPGIFAKFKTEIPILKWLKPNNFDFVAFQTGDFSEAADGTLTFEQGSDVYPRKLWKVILKRIRG